MIGTIRRHQTWLWVIIAGLTISSFVILGPSNLRFNSLFGFGGRGGGGDGSIGKINDREISEDDFQKAFEEVRLHYLTVYGRWPGDDEDARNNIKMETYYRLKENAEEDALGIQIGDDAVADFGRRILMALRVETPDMFEDKVLKPNGMDLSDFERFLRRDLALRQLISVAGINGNLVTPQEAEEVYRKEHAEEKASMAYFAASNYVGDVMVGADDLAAFYSNRVAQYVIPNRVQVDYVMFPLSNYTAKATSDLTNLDSLVDTEFQKLGTNVAELGKTPEAQRVKLREEIIDNVALGLSRRAANEFATADLDPLDQKTPETFAATAKAKGLTVKTTQPFDEDNGPTNLAGADVIAKTAFSSLSADNPFSGEVAAEDGCYVLAFRKSYPSEIPTLRQIESQVNGDYRFARATQVAQRAGANFAASMTNGLPAGVPFGLSAASSGGRVINLPPFTLSTDTPPADLDSRMLPVFKRVAFGTPTGQVSPFVPTRDGGFVLYVQSRTPVADDQVKKDLPDFLSYMRRVRENEAFNLWFNRQIQQDPSYMDTLQHVSQQLRETAATRKQSS
jgi:hypothetical protein